jgi:hypothetical protein
MLTQQLEQQKEFTQEHELERLSALSSATLQFGVTQVAQTVDS